ncbi:LOW QUALITY PROTEIN: glutaminyl-peptide cyclotransferase-like [Bombus bifarius]|uniref:Glutaminyl-peptide cyclotransferase n=1 Tax=Bombus bifarius TaxID=103933 RepID=A0A6P8LCA0_9HYME|nr:LOW QUALITY PROTEIN: glutaminyl-peptide cyclotransferase-like [Bombus vancouverensis nearcticus]XP_033297711.1 LOW QUALITY PROTEIN: glutaminyl-peptide cyclotransferase-like [Bombus bifarius]
MAALRHSVHWKFATEYDDDLPWFVFFLISMGVLITDSNIITQTSFRNEKYYHTPSSLSRNQIITLSDLSNVDHMNEVLDNICVVRIVGTPEHTRVKDYIKKSMNDLNWTVQSDSFEDQTPTFGPLQFENIVAKLNPNAKRYLALACHYDSKYTRERNFEGATDSAVPCAQMINLAKVMKDYLKSIKDNDISLMLIFFDGEEAFKEWGPKDSIYGARHLADVWHNNHINYTQGENVSELDKIDLLVLLDLIGAPDPTFYNYFSNTEKWYSLLMRTESKLASLKKFESYSYGQPTQTYFQPYSVEAYIEDDHIPFLRRDTPILHLIPYPFPKVWHKQSDNRNNIDLKTTENINKILRVFVASYLHINM